MTVTDMSSPGGSSEEERTTDSPPPIESGTDRESQAGGAPESERGANSTTTLILLDRLRAGNDRDAWEALDRRYRPVVLAVARRLGLSHPDAEDVAQQGMLQFFDGWRGNRYDPSLGRLRTWLISIVRHRAIDCVRSQARRNDRESADAQAAALAAIAEDSLTEAWTTEWRRRVLTEAIDRLRASLPAQSKMLEVFEQAALREIPSAQVAESLGMSIAQVYRTKSDVMDRLRELIERVEREWADASLSNP